MEVHIIFDGFQAQLGGGVPFHGTRDMAIFARDGGNLSKICTENGILKFSR